MFREIVSFALMAASVGTALSGPIGGCDDGITCRNITTPSNNLTFACRFAGTPTDDESKNVVLVHGFPEFSDMYSPLMRVLADQGFYSVACNMRGYSPGASPDGVENYLYTSLALDVLNIATNTLNTSKGLDEYNDTTGVEFGLFGKDKWPWSKPKFHLIGHDHGAALGWIVATADPQRVLSFTSLSIPHPNAFSKGLYGKDADKQQQIASQYFTTFVLKNSASLHDNFWWDLMGRTAGDKDSGNFWTTPQDFQKAMYWYNGMFNEGLIAFPPLLSVEQILAIGGPLAQSAEKLRTLFGGKPDQGKPALLKSANATMPTLFVCGVHDTAILCNNTYSRQTEEYVNPGVNYTFQAVDCGHDLLSCANPNVTQSVVASIVDHLVTSSASA